MPFFDFCNDPADDCCKSQDDPWTEVYKLGFQAGRKSKIQELEGEQ